MAGHLDARRNSFLQDPTEPYLVDIIEFRCERLWKDKDFLQQKYVLEQRSIAQIARETVSSRAAIRGALIRFGIKRRERGKPGRRPAQTPYGYRKADGLIVPHQGEQKVIEAIQKMVNDGMSYRKICDFLTSIGVPTKRRGRKWHPEMVSRILKSTRAIS